MTGLSSVTVTLKLQVGPTVWGDDVSPHCEERPAEIARDRAAAFSGRLGVITQHPKGRSFDN